MQASANSVRWVDFRFTQISSTFQNGGGGEVLIFGFLIVVVCLFEDGTYLFQLCFQLTTLFFLLFYGYF